MSHKPKYSEEYLKNTGQKYSKHLPADKRGERGKRLKSLVK